MGLNMLLKASTEEYRWEPLSRPVLVFACCCR